MFLSEEEIAVKILKREKFYMVIDTNPKKDESEVFFYELIFKEEMFKQGKKDGDIYLYFDGYDFKKMIIY